MGRKIPGKKHKGVKDPAKQQAKRLAQLKTKINAPPKDIEEQAIPKSLEHVIELKNRVKEGKIKKKKHNKKKTNELIIMGQFNPKLAHPKARPEKVVPVFSQRPNETGQAFLRRVNCETEAFLRETAFENKYGVEVKRSRETGEIEGMTKKPKDEIDELMKLKAKHKNTNKKKKKKIEPVVKLSKGQKRKQKLEMKKQKKLQDNIDDFKIFKEKVEFGDIVHAPPDLKARPRKSEGINSAKPGRKDLILNSLFNKDETHNANVTNSGTINKLKKRRDMPAGQRRQLEKEQTDVITAYRMLKAKKFADAQ